MKNSSFKDDLAALEDLLQKAENDITLLKDLQILQQQIDERYEDSQDQITDEIQDQYDDLSDSVTTQIGKMVRRTKFGGK